MKKIVITLPYSYNYRNIVLTGVLEKLLLKKNIIYLFLPHALLREKKIKELSKKYREQLFVEELIRPKSRSVANILFNLTAAVMFKIQNTYSYRIKKEFFKRSDKKKYFKFVFFNKFFPNTNNFMKFLIKLFKLSLNNKKLEKKLDEINPDVFFFTLNNKVNEYYYLAYAEKKNISTISLVHSWDVITTKGAFILSTDKVLVWNDVNKREYEFFVDSFLDKKCELIKVGIPQFDIYYDELKKIKNVEKIKKELGVPLDKEIIVYTSSVKYLFPEEKLFIKKIIEDFEKEEFKNKYLYIRLHPQEGKEIYSDIPKIGKNYRLHIPEKRDEKIEDGVIFTEDTLKNLYKDLTIAGLVINLASSITLDATAVEKKVINIAFDYVDRKNKDFSISVERYYYTDHMSKIIDTGEIEVIESYDELSKYIKDYSLKKEDYAKSLRKNYMHNFGGSVEKIIKEILNS